MTTEESMASLLEQMDAELARLRESLAGTDEAVLAQRPPSGKWSVHENVRHLVFAELAHNSHVLPGGREWSAIVLPPHDVRIQLRQKMVGGETTTVAETLEVWEPLHGRVRAALMEHDSPDVRYRLGRHIKHQQQHFREIERLLRAHAKTEKRAGSPTEKSAT